MQSITLASLKKFCKPYKKCIWFLVLVPIVSFIFGYFLYAIVSAFKQPVSTSEVVPLTRPKIRSNMWLEAKELNAELGKPATLRLMLDAKGEVINGTDAIVNFDPTILDSVSATAGAMPANTPFLYPRKDVKENKIYVTAIKKAADDEPTALFHLATITFTPLKKGVTTVSFEHHPGKTTGSTIIRAKDNANILDQVEGARITIQ